MNIFENYLIKIKDLVERNSGSLNIKLPENFRGVTVETPPENFDFDLSCNIALVLGKKHKVNPIKLAENVRIVLKKEIKDFELIDIANPGFLNFKLNDEVLKKSILKISQLKKAYGSNNKKKSYNIEFVSANPTGPMHVGHCRGAVYGDVLSNLLKFNGNKVTKEYYVNDCGVQIANFTKSVFLRIKEIKLKEKFPNDPNLYPGDYIIDIAKKILNTDPNITLDNFKKIYDFLYQESLKHSMSLIKSDLNELGIKHDEFYYESNLSKSNLVSKTVELLEKKNFVVNGFLNPPKGEEIKNWKKIKRLIFKSTNFGDDSDRALQKNDGSWTYFANDLAYHAKKVSRNYDYLINILGADHTGYTKRIKAAVSALSDSKITLECKVCQLVKLYKDGKPFKMSKRSGDFISAKDLLKEVNKDSIRFMMLNRSNDVELDFDFDKVLEKSKDNPVFYVQYCYARINSLFRSLNLGLNDEIKFNDNFQPNIFEKKLLRKIFNWPKVVDTSSIKLEPHRIPFYLYDLSTLFHSYWSKGNEDENFKFIINGKVKNINTLGIIKLVAVVIENGMKILGVSLPKKM